MDYKIQSFPVDEVLAGNKIRFNTNNHGAIPPDYHDTLAKSATKNWIDQFHQSYIVLNIPQTEISWLPTAAQIGQQTGNFPSMYREELDEFLFRFADWNKYFAEGRKYFVRGESTSLKCGHYGAGPYTSLEQIIISLATCIPKHTPLNTRGTNLKLYLLPWMEMNSDLEFRVFVCNRRITAISQQNIYQPNTILARLEPESRNLLIKKWIGKIEKYFDEEIIPKITHLNNFTMDMVLIGGDGIVPYFIEINSFGKEYAAGSALFQWINDEEILYGRNTAKKEFRYVL